MISRWVVSSETFNQKYLSYGLYRIIISAFEQIVIVILAEKHTCHVVMLYSLIESRNGPRIGI